MSFNNGNERRKLNAKWEHPERADHYKALRAGSCRTQESSANYSGRAG